jgi:hypothetical protein
MGDSCELSWRQKAESMFPEIAPWIADADTPYLLWFELREAFEAAYDAIPPDEDLIHRVYRYADWSLAQPDGADAATNLATCVAVCFFEHIPEHPKARSDMPRWWRPEDLEGERNIFGCHLSRQEFADLKQWLASEHHRFDPRLREHYPDPKGRTSG